MATHDKHGHKANTTHGHDHNRDESETDLTQVLRTRTLEVAETLVDAISDHPIRTCTPDGTNWVRTENGLCRKTWTKHHSEDVEEQVQITSPLPTSLWTVIHQRPDGKTVLEERNAPREHAYELVETMIADFEGVHDLNRTGRAAEGD